MPHTPSVNMPALHIRSYPFILLSDPFRMLTGRCADPKPQTPNPKTEPYTLSRLPAQVFAAKDWAALMANSIVPKLAVGLQTELSVAPGASALNPWHWAMAWAGLLPPEQLVQLLEQAFFPHWHAVLHHWLARAPNYDQVTAWYLQWKVGPSLEGLLRQPIAPGWPQCAGRRHHADWSCM